MIATMSRRLLGAVLAVTACQGGTSHADATTSTGPGETSSAPTTTAPTPGDTSSAPTTSGAESSPSTSTADGSTTTGADALPPTPELLTPVDGSLSEPVSLELCWEPVVDPDGDAVRYRVFIDEYELTEGLQGEQEGYDGPCVGPLDFEYDRTYAWQVEAFEVEDPSRTSERSAPWTFTAEGEAGAHVVFLDRFEQDMGWVVGGDATAGAWVRGNPMGTLDAGVRAQPGRCAGGDSCFYTGDNPGGVLDVDDVDGGSTTLTSPALPLGGAAAATIELRRSYYRSDATPGPELRVELLVPDAEAPGGVAVHLLELLDAPTADDPQNLWTPREYAACGIPMVDGSQLRITATDPGDGIVEAAIDTVRVRTHDSAAVCGTGEGGQCDPASGPAACPDAMLCCPRGSVQAGVFRCAEPVAGLDPSNPTPDPEAPNDGPLGCDAPDLIIDPSWIEPLFSDIMIFDNTCELLEGCVDDVGIRTILRFSLAAQNIGSKDLVLGVAANNPDVFHYSGCHDHYHFDDFATYQLFDGDTVVAAGRKQAFCLLDSSSWAWRNAWGKFDCANQGISRGFEDIYESDLPCQWVDVTDVPPGEYTLRAEINPVQPGATVPLLVERDYGNNVVEVPVTIE